jgi:hypothetical protein
MARQHPAITSFNAGELSPLLVGRPDLAKYANGAKRMENMLPTVQGPAKRRGGSHFAAFTKADVKVWIGRFRFSRTQSYLLEFGPLYIRFYANRGQLLNAGTPVEVVTPYTADDLTNADGCFALDLEQSGDLVYIACAGHLPKVLMRTGATTWTFGDYVTKNGPLGDPNPDKALRLYASARTGTVTVTASADVFTAEHVGAFLRLDVENFTIPPWEPQKEFEIGDLVRSDGKTYRANTGGGSPHRVTGSKTPIHEEGIVLDGSGQTVEDTPRPIGIEWEYRDPGYGIGRITAVTNATTATVAVQADTPYPDGAVGNTNPTNAWSLGAWGPHAEYPSHVFFWKDRLGFAGLRRFWLSVPGEYDNFARDIVGQVRADSSITRSLQTTQTIRWIAPTDALLAGTEGAEFIIRKSTETEPLGPANIDADEKSTYGSRALQPQRIGAAVFFAQPAGQRVRGALYDKDAGTYEAPDITVLAEHITRGVIVDWAWQQEPDRILWAVLSTGELIAATVERDQDVIAWHRHPTQGFVEAVNVMPSPDGTRDDVWLVVRRSIGGAQKRAVEWLDPGDEDGRAQSASYFVDCGLTYAGAPAATISGLSHLNGETVTVLADGGTHPPRVVANGSITLERPASVAHIGFGYRSLIETMPIEAGAQLGTAQGKTKRVHRVGIRFHRALGCQLGPRDNALAPVLFRYGRDPLGQAPPLFTGIHEIDFEGDYEQDGVIVIVQDQPLPMTVCALMPELVTNERR